MRILFFVFSFFPFLYQAQIKLDKTEYDFGDLYAQSDRFVDFFLTNSGPKNAYILRLDKSKDYVFQLSESKILPDSTLALRIQVALKSEGPFRISVPVHLSDRNEPVTLILRGNIRENAPDLSSLADCPSFSNTPPVRDQTSFSLTVLTIDKTTKEPLGKSNVELIQQGRTLGNFLTDKNGKTVQKVPLGFTYFYAEHKGYEPAEMGAYINIRRNFIVLELSKTEFEPEREEEKIISDNPSPPENREEEEELVIEIEIGVEEEKQPIKPEETPQPSVPQTPEIVYEPLENLPENRFDTDNFKPNNIVFVLDISSSMRQQERFELMKLSLITLLGQARPEDQITIVAYDNDAEVLVRTTTGDKKEFLIEEVSKIKPGGMTAGGKGIKLGYKMAANAYLEDGNNQVIVITDGAFNKDSEDYERTVKKYAKKNYVLSVVGIKNKAEDEVKMTEVAQIGNGRFIGINSVADAKTKLFQEIRQASYRGSR